jgi:hypothetical protein
MLLVQVGLAGCPTFLRWLKIKEKKIMKIILLNDIDSHETDAAFCVPDEVSSNDVNSYIENCRNIAGENISILEIAEKNLPDNWFYADKWGNLKTIYY